MPTLSLFLRPGGTLLSQPDQYFSEVKWAVSKRILPAEQREKPVFQEFCGSLSQAIWLAFSTLVHSFRLFRWQWTQTAECTVTSQKYDGSNSTRGKGSTVPLGIRKLPWSQHCEARESFFRSWFHRDVVWWESGDCWGLVLDRSEEMRIFTLGLIQRWELLAPHCSWNWRTWLHEMCWSWAVLLLEDACHIVRFLRVTEYVRYFQSHSQVFWVYWQPWLLNYWNWAQIHLLRLLQSLLHLLRILHHSMIRCLDQMAFSWLTWALLLVSRKQDESSKWHSEYQK